MDVTPSSSTSSENYSTPWLFVGLFIMGGVLIAIANGLVITVVAKFRYLRTKVSHGVDIDLSL